MDRAFYNNQLALETKVAQLYLRATIGASGAVTLDSTASKGITSIAKTATGRYTVTLDDAYVAMLGCAGLGLETTSVTAADAHQAVLRSEDVDGSPATLIISTLRTDTSAEADPASGAVLRATLLLKASTV